MFEKISLFFKKYFIPVIFLIIGIGILVIGIRDKQGILFNFSAVLMFAAGAMSIFYSSGKLTPKVGYIIGAVTGIIAVVLFFLSFTDVKNSQTWEINKLKCQALSERNLQDIQFIQKKYKEQYGKYISDWDELIRFTNEGTMPYVRSEGVVPSEKINVEERKYLYNDNRAINNLMTEEEAYRLSKWKEGPRYDELFRGFRRDTVQKSILKLKFQNASYKESRVKSEFYEFNPDSLPVIPFTNTRWKLETLDSLTYNDATAPAIYVHGEIPFGKTQGAKKRIKYSFGSLSSHDTRGSWEEK